jgi:hypothetical protein
MCAVWRWGRGNTEEGMVGSAYAEAEKVSLNREEFEVGHEA